MLVCSAGAGFAQTVDSSLWVTDRQVNAIVRDGGTIYFGGSFSYVGPPTGGGAVVDAGTGAALRPYQRIDGRVLTIAPDGSGGWYLGGSFTRVHGHPRGNLAHLDANGNLTAWDPNANSIVATLA